jgi:hypothetical protein
MAHSKPERHEQEETGWFPLVTLISAKNARIGESNT